MEVAQDRGFTLCPIDALSDSDNETSEDLGLSTPLSIHQREDLSILSGETSVEKDQPANDPLIVVLIALFRTNEPWSKYAPSIILANSDGG